jgi:hypothetical protein
MILDSYTFDLLPGQMTVLKPVKDNATVQTYTDVAYFSWEPSIVGKIITLRWNAMTIAQFDSIDAIYQADAEVEFDPTSYTGSDTYNVQVPKFDGAYWTGDIPNRLNCELELLIMSVVV